MTELELNHLPLHRIDPHPRNVRRDVGDVTELAASIKTTGVLEPLIVAPPDADFDPVADRTRHVLLIAGHRRLAAAAEAGLATVPCVIRPDLVDEQRQLQAMLVENLHRADLSPVEEGEAYEQLLAFDDVTETKLAKSVGRSRGTVRGRLRLARLDDDVKDRVHAGQVSLGDVDALAPFAGAPTVHAHLASLLGTSRFRWEVERAHRERERAAKIANARKVASNLGVKCTEVYPGTERVARLVVADTGEPVTLADPMDRFVAWCEPGSFNLVYFRNPGRTLTELGWRVRDAAGATGGSTEDGHPVSETAAPDAPDEAAADDAAARAAAAAQRREDHDIAHRLRRAHLREQLERATCPPEAWALIGYQLLLEAPGNSGVMELLELEEGDDWESDVDHLVAELTMRPWQVLLAVAVTGEDPTISFRRSRRMPEDLDQVARAYRDWLTATGFSFTPTDRELWPVDDAADDQVDEQPAPTAP